MMHISQNATVEKSISSALLAILSGLLLIPASLFAQIKFDKTYSFLSGGETTPLFVNEIANNLQLTGCIEDEWAQVSVNAANGGFSNFSAATQPSCNSIQLTDGQTLTFDSDGSDCHFRQYRGSTLIWEKVLTNLNFEVTPEHVMPHSAGGFYFCQPTPLVLEKYDQSGELIYHKELNIPTGHTAKMATILANDDLYLRIGHVANNNRRLTVAKVAGATGNYLWTSEIEGAEKMTLHSHIAASTDYNAVAVTNHFVDDQGWEVTFLEEATGELMSTEAFFTFLPSEVFPIIIPNKGAFLVETKAVADAAFSADNQEITLHRYNEFGVVFSRIPLLNSGLKEDRKVSQIAVTSDEDVLMLGNRNDSLWLVKFNPTGDLSEIASGSDDAPDLVIKISADRPDLPLYDFLTFTLTVRNEGGKAAEDIRINAPFIDYQTLTATGIESVTHGVFYNWTGNWDIEQLSPGEEATLTIRTFVLDNRPTFRYFSIFSQAPADFDNTNNSILLNLPYTGVLSADIELLSTNNNSSTTATIQQGMVQVSLENATAGATDFALFNLNGQLVQRESIALYKGNQRIEMSIGHLPKGIYILRRSDTGKSWKVFY